MIAASVGCPGHWRAGSARKLLVDKFSDTLSDAAGSVVLLPVPGGGKPPNYKVGDRDASFDAADTEVLELGVVEDAVFGALASHAGLLHPAERRDLRRDDAGV